MPEHRAVRLSRSELPRSTVQTAIVMAPALGVFRGERGPDGKDLDPQDTLRGIAAQEMTRVLGTSLLHINLKLVDNWEKRPVQDACDSMSDHRPGILRAMRCDGVHKELSAAVRQAELDAVLTPLDGAGALLEGRSGSATIVAAAKPGAFVGSDQWTTKSAARGFLVFAFGSDALAVNGVAKELEQWEKSYGTEADSSVRDWVPANNPINPIAVSLARDRFRPVVAYTAEGSHFRLWKPHVSEYCSLRRTDGSAFVAALAAYTNRVAATVCVARFAPTIQMAVAARSFGGRLVALPLSYEKASGQKMDGGTVFIRLGTRALSEKDFVQDDNGIVVCTSITEVCVMDRVRFGNGGRVSTETISASIVSHRYSRSGDWLDLHKYPFIGSEMTPQRAIDVLEHRWGKLP